MKTVFALFGLRCTRKTTTFWAKVEENFFSPFCPDSLGDCTSVRATFVVSHFRSVMRINIPIMNRNRMVEVINVINEFGKHIELEFEVQVGSTSAKGNSVNRTSWQYERFTLYTCIVLFSRTLFI